MPPRHQRDPRLRLQLPHLWSERSGGEWRAQSATDCETCELTESTGRLLPKGSPTRSSRTEATTCRDDGLRGASDGTLARGGATSSGCRPEPTGLLLAESATTSGLLLSTTTKEPATPSSTAACHFLRRRRQRRRKFLLKFRHSVNNGCARLLTAKDAGAAATKHRDTRL